MTVRGRICSPRGYTRASASEFRTIAFCVGMAAVTLVSCAVGETEDARNPSQIADRATASLSVTRRDPAPDANVGARASDGARVRGSVRVSDGSDVPRDEFFVVVRRRGDGLERGPFPGGEVPVDARGDFSFEWPWRVLGEIELRRRSPGLHKTQIAHFTPVPEEPASLVQIVVPPSQRVDGTVRDERGDGVPRLRLVVSGPERSRYFVTCRSDGTFDFNAPAGCEFTIRLLSRKFCILQHEYMGIARGGNPLELGVLTAAFGRLTFAADAQPIPRGAIAILRNDGVSYSIPVSRRGEVEIRGMLPGRYTLAWSTGAEEREVRGVQLRAGLNEVDITATEREQGE